MAHCVVSAVDYCTYLELLIGIVPANLRDRITVFLVGDI